MLAACTKCIPAWSRQGFWIFWACEEQQFCGRSYGTDVETWTSMRKLHRGCRRSGTTTMPCENQGTLAGTSEGQGGQRSIWYQGTDLLGLQWALCQNWWRPHQHAAENCRYLSGTRETEFCEQPGGWGTCEGPAMPHMRDLSESPLQSSQSQQLSRSKCDAGKEPPVSVWMHFSSQCLNPQMVPHSNITEPVTSRV